MAKQKNEEPKAEEQKTEQLSTELPRVESQTIEQQVQQSISQPKVEPPTPPDDEEKVVFVRVICKGTLGPLLLPEGGMTDDEQYVALLKTKRGRTLVEEVK